MYNHAPTDYVCPICLAASGVEDDQTYIRSSDILHLDDNVMVFVASYFIKSNPGHLIVVPIQHFEHLYDLPEELGAEIFALAKLFSVIMKKAYKCQGVTVIQNNEPAGGQHAFHYHLHLFPRYSNDDFYQNLPEKRLTTPEERTSYAEKLKSVFIDEKH